MPLIYPTDQPFHMDLQRIAKESCLILLQILLIAKTKTLSMGSKSLIFQGQQANLSVAIKMTAIQSPNDAHDRDIDDEYQYIQTRLPH